MIWIVVQQVDRLCRHAIKTKILLFCLFIHYVEKYQTYRFGIKSSVVEEVWLRSKVWGGLDCVRSLSKTTLLCWSGEAERRAIQDTAHATSTIALAILDMPDRVRSTQNGRMVCGVGRLLWSVDICIHVVVKNDVKRNLPITNLFITLHKLSQLT